MKKALITGISGQDGSYLAELLIDKGYEVHGIRRRTSMIHTTRIDSLYQNPEYKEKRLFLYYGDVTDSSNMSYLINKIKPEEIYHLAAQSHVAVSFELPEYTANTDALGTLRILEAIRMNRLESKIKFYQASTSELYGATDTEFQDENTPFRPQSPYATAKLYAYWSTKNYRDAYGIFASNGILFNHESPRRGETFVTRKITRAVSAIVKNQQDCLYVGNLNSKRDWGYAKEYVEGMWRIVQHHKADDFVLATGETHTIREFINLAFSYVDTKITWEGSGKNEVGKDSSTGKTLIKIDPKYYRPLEVSYLCGDASKAKKELGWQATTKMEELVKIMMEHELKN